MFFHGSVPIRFNKTPLHQKAALPEQRPFASSPLGNVAATSNTASSNSPSCVHCASGSGCICFSVHNIDARNQTAIAICTRTANAFRTCCLLMTCLAGICEACVSTGQLPNIPVGSSGLNVGYGSFLRNPSINPVGLLWAARQGGSPHAPRTEQRRDRCLHIHRNAGLTITSMSRCFSSHGVQRLEEFHGNVMHHSVHDHPRK